MDLPGDLLAAFDPKSGRNAIAFVGSGPSIACGLPSWPELLRELGVEYGLEDDIAPSLNDGRFLDVAQYLVRIKGEAALQEKVADIFRRRRRLPGDLHSLIMALPFAGIITTNYDLLLSDADQQRRFARPISQRTGGLRKQLESYFVFHLHGHVEDPVSIVLSKSSYDRFVFGSNREAWQFVRTIFELNVVLFIGFGFRDQNIDLLLGDLQDLGAVSGWNVYALVPMPDADHPDKVVESALRQRSVNPIFVPAAGDHGATALIAWLRALARAVAAMTHSRQQPFSDEPQFALIRELQDNLTSDVYEPLLRSAVAKLADADRPDLLAAMRGRLDSRSVTDLFGRIDLQEARTIFIEVNRARRSPWLERLLSSLPPAPVGGSALL